MPYNFVADSFHTKILCSRLSSSEVRFWTEIGRFAFLAPFGGLGGNVRWALRLVGKHVGDLRVLIELFSLGRTDWALWAIIAPTGAGWPKISGRKCRPINHSSCEKTRLNDLSYGIKIWIDFSSVLSQFTRLTKGGSDRRTEFHAAR